MAWVHDDFYRQVVELLLFRTNKGEMSLKEYLTKIAPNPTRNNKIPLYYFSNALGAAQAYKLADACGFVVINSGGRFEEELLEKYAGDNEPTVYLERLDATDNPALFHRLDTTAEVRFKQLEIDMEGMLRRSGVSNLYVQTRQFSPPRTSCRYPAHPGNGNRT